MTSETEVRTVGGIAPFGYRWDRGRLIVDPDEAPVRRLIFDLFLKYRRKKSVARVLNDLGYRTRRGAMFSDTTIGRLIRDSVVTGIREENGQAFEIEPIVDHETWVQANALLGEPKVSRQAVQLFSGIIECSCGGKMQVPSNSPKYVCETCRYKIPTNDLEAVFRNRLEMSESELLRDLHFNWDEINRKEKRLAIEQICDRIVAGRDAIAVEFGFAPHSPKPVTDGQQNKTINRSEPLSDEDGWTTLTEPLLSEPDAAKFLGISKMTLLRNRNAGGIGFFRVGFRVLYSKEKHLVPFLKERERGV
jgi:hypothetical protein